MVKAVVAGGGSAAELIAEGAPQIRTAFLSMTDSLQRKYLRQAVRDGGMQIVRAARDNLRNKGMVTRVNAALEAMGYGPVRYKRKKRRRKGKATIGLARSLRVRPSSQWPSGASAAQKGIIAATVGAKWPEGAHAHLVEYGHRMVTHDGRHVGTVPPSPFFRPAVNFARPNVKALLAKRVAMGIKNEARKALARSEV